jgi:hypothetical protein
MSVSAFPPADIIRSFDVRYWVESSRRPDLALNGRTWMETCR